MKLCLWGSVWLCFLLLWGGSGFEMDFGMN